MRLSGFVFISSCLALSTVIAAADDSSPAKAILNAWETASSWTDNCSYESESRADRLDRSGEHFLSLDLVNACLSSDGRFDLAIHRWNRLKLAGDTPESATGLSMHYIFRPNDATLPLVAIVEGPHRKREIQVEPSGEADALRHSSGDLVDGFILSPNEPTWRYLQQHPDLIEIHQDTSDGKNLDVLDGKTPYGRINIALDRDHGSNLYQFTMIKGVGDILRADTQVKLPFDIHNPLDQGIYGKVVGQETTVDSVKYLQINKRWVITGYHAKAVQTFADGVNPTVVNADYNRKNFNLTPDFAKMHKFEINAAEGTEVYTGEEGIKHEWHNGAPVPTYNKNTVDSVDKQVEQINGGGK